MLRQIFLTCLVLIFALGVPVYGQSSTTVKVKPLKKVKVQRPPEPKLTPAEKVARNASIKNARRQQNALEKQRKQTARDIKAQQKAYRKVLRTAEKQAKKK
jgi:hypothetical protein